MNQLQGRKFDGWLIGLVVTVCVFTLSVLITFLAIHLPLWLSGDLRKLSSPLYTPNNPALAMLIKVETVALIGFAGVGGYLIFLFFKRSYKFPNTYIWVVILYFIFGGFDMYVARKALPGQLDQLKWSPLQLIVAAALAAWIPYLLKSRRAEETFVK